MKYAMIITNDASRCRFVVCLKDKGEASKKLIEFTATIRKSSGAYPREWRIDGGKEFLIFSKWATEHGTSVQPSAPYSQQQNGISEYSGYHLTQTARTMIINAGAPYSPWPEAVKPAACTIKRMNLRCGNKSSPMEIWRIDLSLRDQPTTLADLRIWYSRAYVNMPPEKRIKAMKMSPRACIGHLVGYEGGNRPLYRVYDLITKKIWVSRDVTFWEGHEPMSLLNDVVEEITKPTTRESDAFVCDEFVPAIRLTDKELGEPLPKTEQQIQRRQDEMRQQREDQPPAPIQEDMVGQIIPGQSPGEQSTFSMEAQRASALVDRTSTPSVRVSQRTTKGQRQTKSYEEEFQVWQHCHGHPG